MESEETAEVEKGNGNVRLITVTGLFPMVRNPLQSRGKNGPDSAAGVWFRWRT
jgi:hypothetical protein